MSTATSTSTGLTFSEHEMKLLAYAWQCFDSEPKIDYEKLAPLAGYTVGSAKVTLGKLKRKMKAATGDTAGSATTPKGTPSTTPRKRKTTTKGDDASPTKRSRKSKAAAAPAPPSEPEDDDEALSMVKKEESANFLSSSSDCLEANDVAYQYAA